MAITDAWTSPTVIEWGAAGLALGEPGEAEESGDLHAVVPFEAGVLVAVIDGLGHGPEAAFAAKTAVGALEPAPGDSVVTLVERCHERLRPTRGAVMTLASFSARESLMTWIGVGNVEAVLVRADPERPRESVTTRGGVVGFQLPLLQPTTLSVSPGDTLIMVTDGVRAGFLDGVSPRGRPQEVADSILAMHRRASDDALVVVARYVGASS